MKGLEQYQSSSYIKKQRLINYWYVVDAVRSFAPKSVLEVGVGNGIVTKILRTFVPRVTTVYIDSSLLPDIVASIEELPLPDASVDVAVADEFLEHLPFKSFAKSLVELRRVVRQGAVLSIPHYGAVFSFSMKVPLMRFQHFIFKIPYFWKTKPLSSEHEWEIGLKEYPLSRIDRAVREAGFIVAKRLIGHDDSYRMIFILKKRYESR